MQRTGRLSVPRVTRSRRSIFAQAGLAAAMVLLLAAAARLQVLEVGEWTMAAMTNRVREVIVPAPRGTIYDRHGQVVAENVVGYRVMLMPGNRDSMNAQLKRLQVVLGITDAEIVRAQKKWAREPHLPMTVMADAPESAVARLEEQRLRYPGVLVHEYAKRHYPAGSAVAHMIGYVSEVNEEQLASPTWQGYKQGWWIGQAGLERAYEKVIGGQPGSDYLEIDAMGRIKRWLPEEMGMPPIPGNDLQLYLDLDLQRYIQAIWPRQYRGAFVALDPQTGGVLAYYSHPDFDPNQFIGGIPDTLWKRLNANESKPLLDRAGGSGAGQPPASTWKLMVAAMALEEKVITPDEYMPVPCTGGIFILGRYARCWVETGHGKQNLVGGIFNSCDVYFYQVGARLGLKRMTMLGTRMGYQKKTGIDLPNEQRNQFPTGPEYWQRTLGYAPKPSEVISLAIGQGPNTMTPLKNGCVIRRSYTTGWEDDRAAPRHVGQSENRRRPQPHPGKRDVAAKGHAQSRRTGRHCPTLTLAAMGLHWKNRYCAGLRKLLGAAPRMVYWHGGSPGKGQGDRRCDVSAEWRARLAGFGLRSECGQLLPESETRKAVRTVSDGPHTIREEPSRRCKLAVRPGRGSTNARSA